MIRIQGAANPARIEEMLTELVGSKDDNLQIPVKPHDWWLGGEQSLIELVITWARISSSPTLHTHIAADEKPAVQLKRLAQRIFGFVALMMADEIRDREASRTPSTGELRSLRTSAYQQCREVVEMMYQPIDKFALGSKVFLISVDHSTKAAIPWMYAPNGSVADRPAFVTLAKDLFKRTNLRVSAGQPLLQSSHKIGAVLHELFKNTHEWALTDASNVPWRRSVRGLAAEFHTKEFADLQGIANDNPALARYFNALHPRSPGNRLAFLELTVFDSGIGLARRWLNTPSLEELPLPDEFKACMQCLTKHRTTSNRRDRGLGLAEVMQVLSSMEGFLKIRTGRLSLYRDFVHSPLRAVPDDVGLGDFPSCTATLTNLAAVYGTHFQMLIPIP